MGFIEDLRKQKEVVRQEAQETEKAKQLVHAKAEQAQKAEERDRQAKIPRINKERQQAYDYLNKSKFPELVLELSSLIKDIKKEYIDIDMPRLQNYSGHSWESENVNATIILQWGGKTRHTIIGRTGTVKSVVSISCSPDGTIEVNGKRSYSLSFKEWSNNANLREEVLEKAYHSPRAVRYTYPPSPPAYGGHGSCLSGNSRISTPNGLVLIKDLRIGDYVWTVDRFGQRVQTVIVKKTKRIASKNHKVAHIILKDGRELVVSPGHPTIDYREIGSLVKGDDFDMSYVDSIKIIPYRGKFTYDILPYGDTGGYWANGILIGSTLSSQFQRTLLDGLYKPLHLSF